MAAGGIKLGSAFFELSGDSSSLIKVFADAEQRSKQSAAAIAQATGSKFSAIPTDNSTGNFIKVQQRVPVKIEFVRNRQNDEFLKRFRAGMNVEVRIAK